MAIAWVFAEHHVSTLGELGRFITFSGGALFWAGVMWPNYIALEPFVRRRWPDMLVGWNRLLAGRLRDALVGRDLLVGCAAGVVWALWNLLGCPIGSWFGAPQVQPYAGLYLGTLYLLSGARAIAAGVAGLLYTCIFATLFILFMLFLLRVVLRSTRAAAVAFSLIFIASFAMGADWALISWVQNILILVTMLFVLIRYGPLAYAATFLFACLLLSFPIMIQPVWYSGIGLTGLGLLLALTLYAFHTSLGAQPLFGHATLED